MPGWFTAAVGHTHLAGEDGAELPRELPWEVQALELVHPGRLEQCIRCYPPAAKHLEM